MHASPGNSTRYSSYIGQKQMERSVIRPKYIVHWQLQAEPRGACPASYWIEGKPHESTTRGRTTAVRMGVQTGECGRTRLQPQGGRRGGGGHTSRRITTATVRFVSRMGTDVSHTLWRINERANDWEGDDTGRGGQGASLVYGARYDAGADGGFDRETHSRSHRQRHQTPRRNPTDKPTAEPRPGASNDAFRLMSAGLTTTHLLQAGRNARQ